MLIIMIYEEFTFFHQKHGFFSHGLGLGEDDFPFMMATTLPCIEISGAIPPIPGSPSPTTIPPTYPPA